MGQYFRSNRAVCFIACQYGYYGRRLYSQKSLRGINLSDCSRLTGEAMDHLANMPWLEALSLSGRGNAIEWIPENKLQLLTRLPKLEALDASGIVTSDNAIKDYIKQLTNLQYLALAVEDEILSANWIEPLLEFPNLRYLDPPFNMKRK